MLLRKLFLLLTLCLAAVAAQAAYTVHNVTGNVTVAKKTGSVAVTKGMELTANETLVLEKNASVEIYNSATKDIYKAEGPARLSVMDVMMNARRSASSELSTMTKYIRFGPQERSNTRKYTEGSVKRSMQVYDPEGGNMTVDPHQLAVNIISGLNSKTAAHEIPVETNHAPMGETGLEFRVHNTLDFPVYLNVIKIDNKNNVELSELGQPTGCYVLLPGQAISREHADGLDSSQRHVLVMTHCQFDIDDLLNSINELNASGEKLTPDESLSVYQLIL